MAGNSLTFELDCFVPSLFDIFEPIASIVDLQIWAQTSEKFDIMSLVFVVKVDNCAANIDPKTFSFKLIEETVGL